jgi:hypothetical protein
MDNGKPDPAIAAGDEGYSFDFVAHCAVIPSDRFNHSKSAKTHDLSMIRYFKKIRERKDGKPYMLTIHARCIPILLRIFLARDSKSEYVFLLD